MSSRTGDGLHWDFSRANAILPRPPRNERRQEISHVDQPIRSPDRSGTSHPAGRHSGAEPHRSGRRRAQALPTHDSAQIAPASFGLAPRDGMTQHRAVLGGFTLLLLAPAWITFLRSEANTR